MADARQQALQILAKLHTQGNEYDPSTQLEFQEICETLAYEKATEGSWKSLIKPCMILSPFVSLIPVQMIDICGQSITSRDS